MRPSGFTLIEVAIALAIFALSLGALLDVQAQCLHNASRARGLTIAALLARAKMIDIEQKLFDEGFNLNDESDEGDFDAEGHGEVKWSYEIVELELELSSLTSLCGGFAADADDEGAELSSCAGMLGALGGPLDALTEELGRSMRLVKLTVSWPEGKFTESMNLRAIVTREDFGLQPIDMIQPVP